MRKITKLSFDGKQLTIRIPRIIKEKMELKKGNFISWEISGKKIILNKIERRLK